LAAVIRFMPANHLGNHASELLKAMPEISGWNAEQLLTA
jgi:hypothetical protein